MTGVTRRDLFVNLAGGAVLAAASSFLPATIFAPKTQLGSVCLTIKQWNGSVTTTGFHVDFIPIDTAFGYAPKDLFHLNLSEMQGLIGKSLNATVENIYYRVKGRKGSEISQPFQITASDTLTVYNSLTDYYEQESNRHHACR